MNTVVNNIIGVPASESETITWYHEDNLLVQQALRKATGANIHMVNTAIGHYRNALWILSRAKKDEKIAEFQKKLKKYEQILQELVK